MTTEDQAFWRQAHAENLARLEVMPVRQFLRRRKAMEAARGSYVSARGVGLAVARPRGVVRTKLAAFDKGFEAWANEWRPFPQAALVAGYFVCAIIALVAIIPGPAPTPNTLPKGVSQEGFTFYVDPTVARDDLDYDDDLCDRLPEGSNFNEVKSVKNDGGIVVVKCEYDN